MTRERRPRHLDWLTPAHALVAAIILLAAGVVVSIYEDQIFREQRIREVTVQAKIIAANVTAALVFGDQKVTGEHVGSLKINPAVEAAGVYDVEGTLVAGFARDGTDSFPRAQPSPQDEVPAGRSIVAVPVMQDGVRLGAVFIRALEEPLESRLLRHAWIMLLAVMAALLVAAMGSSQRILREANRQLEARAVALTEMNQRLKNEMEERSKAEDALRQSQKMEVVGQLSGGLAHDFNNLLTIIQGNLHLLSTREGDDPGMIQTYVDGANQAVERAGHLARRLLTFARRQPLMPTVVDINRLAIGMKELILHSVGKEVRVEWQLSATWKTLCDVNQTENVLLNLSINARDAMPEGGVLTIITRDVSLPEGGLGGEIAPGDYVELSVRDTGTGMTDEVRTRAGDPFFTTKPQGQGTGLGLSMAFAFIRQSSGHMRFETASGEGTTIEILLPRHLE